MRGRAQTPEDVLAAHKLPEKNTHLQLLVPESTKARYDELVKLGRGRGVNIAGIILETIEDTIDTYHEALTGLNGAKENGHA